jgi:hypothetical protein
MTPSLDEPAKRNYKVIFLSNFVKQGFEAILLWRITRSRETPG